MCQLAKRSNTTTNPQTGLTNREEGMNLIQIIDRHKKRRVINLDNVTDFAEDKGKTLVCFVGTSDNHVTIDIDYNDLRTRLPIKQTINASK